LKSAPLKSSCCGSGRSGIESAKHAFRLESIAGVSAIPVRIAPLDGGVFEMKIDFGPGYRVYYAPRGALIVILLCGGDKSTQSADIRKAKGLAREL